MAQAAGQRWVLPRDEKSVAVMCDPPSLLLSPSPLPLLSLSLSLYIYPLSSFSFLSSPHSCPTVSSGAGRAKHRARHESVVRM
jgi:hypothetical protein